MSRRSVGLRVHRSVVAAALQRVCYFDGRALSRPCGDRQHRSSPWPRVVGRVGNLGGSCTQEGPIAGPIRASWLFRGVPRGDISPEVVRCGPSSLLVTVRAVSRSKSLWRGLRPGAECSQGCSAFGVSSLTGSSAGFVRVPCPGCWRGIGTPCPVLKHGPRSARGTRVWRVASVRLFPFAFIRNPLEAK